GVWARSQTGGPRRPAPLDDRRPGPPRPSQHGGRPGRSQLPSDPRPNPFRTDLRGDRSRTTPPELLPDGPPDLSPAHLQHTCLPAVSHRGIPDSRTASKASCPAVLQQCCGVSTAS
ncbi:unnamed protein product, partial [Ixodes pacificus]